MSLDPQTRALLDQLAAQAAPPLTALSPQQARARLEAETLLLGPAPNVARVEDAAVPGPEGAIPVRIYTPASPGPDAAMVFFHGGGWVIGSIATHDSQCREFANEARCVVVSVEYRLAPEHRFPAAPEDCYAATAWVAAKARELGADPDRLVVCGDSAGGNLAAVVGLMARDRGGPNLALQVLISRKWACPMRRRLFVLASVLVMPTTLGATPTEKAGTLKVVFLGDRQGHGSADRVAPFIQMIAGRGIEIDYNDDPAALNPLSLRKYDALIIYADIDAISPAQEKALLDYVAGGGGLVAIHCASNCFRNSSAYVALVGAQFLRHGAGEFETKIVDRAHPVMKGFEPFRTWDETYVHHRHNEVGRHLLQVRIEENSAEPWTWLRTQGRGRVFYTAYGHDERTWRQPGFQDLIRRAVRWASGRSPSLTEGPCR